MSIDLDPRDWPAMEPNKKPAEDVADWEVRMISGEVMCIYNAVIYKGGNHCISFYRPETEGRRGLLFMSDMDRVDRVIRKAHRDDGGTDPDITIIRAAA